MKEKKEEMMKMMKKEKEGEMEKEEIKALAYYEKGITYDCKKVLKHWRNDSL